MVGELTVPDASGSNLRLTREQFNAVMFPDNSTGKSLLHTLLSDSSEAYDGLSPLVKVLIKNVIPGMGIGTDLLEAIKAQKEKRAGERLYEVLYQLCNGVIELDSKIKNHQVDIEHIEQQLPALLEQYIDHSMEAYQLEKIEYFKNILVNGTVDYDRDLDEKAHIFSLATSLTSDQILVIKLVYDSKRSMKVEEISDALSIDKAYISQLCISLTGAGLLYKIMGDSINVFDGFSQASVPTNEFMATEYTKQFVDYITETRT